ncbi:MAG TPA: DUF2461 domain-containing protein [Prolixibacteraceae bacterium]|nr:DUF2461 domain-containing protein [Prolixibacteraceae bacterium]
MKEIYEFLTQLEANNNREWFEQHKDVYRKNWDKFSHLTEILINEIRSFDREVPYTEPKKCMFRIYRDVRFSYDKSPYKTNFGTFIAKNGYKSGNPGYYFHIQPGECFVSGGIYMPQPDALKAIRDEIYYHTSDFLEIIEAPEFKNTFAFFNGDKLKTNPKGYPKEFEHIDLLRHKSFAPYMPLTEEQLFSPDLIDLMIEKYKLILPLNRFLYEALKAHNE